MKITNSIGVLQSILLSIFLLTSSVLFVNKSFAAEDAAEKEQAKLKLEQLQQKIRKAKNNLHTNKKRYNQAAKQLKNIEQNVANISAELRALKKKLAIAGKELDLLKIEQRQLNRNKVKQKKALAKQIRAAYGNGKEEYLKLLLNQDDPAEFGRMLGYFSYLNKARSKEINQLTKTVKRLTQIVVDIEKRKVQLSGLATKAQRKIVQLEKQQKKRKKVAQRWQKKVNSSGKRLSSLLADEKELETIIKTVREAIEVFMPGERLSGLSKLKKKLRWPVKGKIKSHFGKKRYSGRMRWKGVLLTAKEGNSVHSISSGRVVFADWLRGYGLMMIIDHGKKYLTLYGHNQTLLKKVGDWIEPGEVISLVGNTGGQETSALYFEIRYNNKPVNPALWCVK